MHQILVYGDSFSWGIIPNTRNRYSFNKRWTGVMEKELLQQNCLVRVIEDCLNGRRTVWEDPFKPGRKGIADVEQRIEIFSPISLVILLLGTNDFQSVHTFSAWESAQGTAAIVSAIRKAPIEPSMPIPEILIVAPPPILNPSGLMTQKFEGAEKKSARYAFTLEQVARLNECYYFNSGDYVKPSNADGIHLDSSQHILLGQCLAKEVLTIFSKDKQ